MTRELRVIHCGTGVLCEDSPCARDMPRRWHRER